MLLPEGPVVTFSSMPPLVEGHWCDHTSLHQHTFVTHDGEALMAARPVPGVELLCGQHVVVVRCEEINISGTFMRNKRECSSSFALIIPCVERIGATAARARRVQHPPRPQGPSRT